jgi:uncharacterized protein YodC (DUF2158 family)
MESSEVMKIGDVVQLKSGGLPMTVCAIAETATGVEIRCQWFQSYGAGHRLARGSFSVEVLEKVDVEEPF